MEERTRVLLSVQRALLGEITPGMRAIAVDWDQERIRIRVLHDGPWDASLEADFDAGAVSQVVADFPWPERGDPHVVCEFVRLDGQRALPELPKGAAYVYSRNDEAWRA
jgi:hypothetical protein